MPSPNPNGRKAPCIALIADMVKSRDLPTYERPEVQKRFKALVSILNHKYSKQILARFVITLGDEFQGLLHSSLTIPDIIWDIEENFPDRILRTGIGFGVLHTAVPKVAINVDGPALHNARAAIEKAKDRPALGGVFVGFGSLDSILNGVARILWFHRSGFTEQQRKILTLLRKHTFHQSDVAKEMDISRQAVSKQVLSAGLQAYAECEEAWRTIFGNYVEPMIGGPK
jgi:hypothetical protein